MFRTVQSLLCPTIPTSVHIWLGPRVMKGDGLPILGRGSGSGRGNSVQIGLSERCLPYTANRNLILRPRQ